MKFEIKELDEKVECFKINFKKNNFKDLKSKLKENSNVSLLISSEMLNLQTKLYGSNKQETKQIQKENCKQIINVYKRVVKSIKIIKKYNKNFNGILFTENLLNKKNNNDFMLCAMLEIKFNVKPFKKMKYAMLKACDYIDLENKINNMCDFKDNKCIKHREKNIDKNTGCCISTCKFAGQGKCPVKCLSCKLFMCKYLTELGYCFFPHYIPILKLNMSVFERWASLGYLFRSEKETLRFLWIIRGIITMYVVVIATIFVMLLINII